MFKKRNVVLAALILALGTAVYINWQYTAKNNVMVSTGGSASSNMAQLGDVLYVNGEVASNGGESMSSMENSDAEKPSAQFTEASLSRQRARDEAAELLKQIIASAESNDAAKKEAVAAAEKLAAAITQESKIESLLKAKGYQNCLAFIEGTKANILVQSEGLLPNETITIKDIVQNQSGTAFADIIIVEVK